MNEEKASPLVSLLVIGGLALGSWAGMIMFFYYLARLANW